MIYPGNFEDKLEFTRIRELIRKNCISNLGSAKVDEIRFTHDRNKVITQLSQTSEFKKILQSGETFPAVDYFDYGPYLPKASKIDSSLSEEEFHNLKLSLTTIKQILEFLSKSSERYPELSLLSVGIYLNPRLLKEINSIIDEHGKVRDHASAELGGIRSSLRKQHFRVRRIMEKLLSEYIGEGYSNDDATVTIRNGRLVLPVRSEYKRSTGGFIHDESASGQTAFIEPASALEINNDILDLEYQEKRELNRILSDLTSIIRPEIGNLQKCLEFLGMVDFIRAKAKLALLLDACMPTVVRKPLFRWKEARHPLLYLAHKAIKKNVVPLDIDLDSENRILIISGPNAGGKSVCLKSIGLIQYMVQCGLLVPMSENSEAGLFNSILVDIGDEQSIENDLSTYSSHLINMKAFLSYTAGKSLFLIDEFGAGTEPRFGGAIAEAILDHLVGSKAYGIITTHYSNLKKYAAEHPGVINGAMRYDLEKMEPRFELDMGKPGSSFAIEIAAKIGLPEPILHAAKKRVGFELVNYEKLLVELVYEKRELSAKILQFADREKDLKKLVKEYEELKGYLENRKQEIIKEARSQALEILNETNRTVEKTIRDIKESQADKKITRTARERIEKRKKEIRASGITESVGYAPSAAGLQVGAMARIRDQETVGQVISIKGKETELAVGQIKIKVPTDRLEAVREEKSGGRKHDTSSRISKTLNLTEKMQHFSDTLDIRGYRATEVTGMLDQYLDQALYLNKKEVRILHGKGNGILRKLVREQLLQYEFIESARDEHADRGGTGITIVALK